MVFSSGGFDYATYDAVFNHMLPSEIDAANCALDMMREEEREAIERAKRGN